MVEPAVEKELDDAQARFSRLAATKFFSSPMVNRFFFQALQNGDGVLVVGSAGAVTLVDGEAPFGVVDLVGYCQSSGDYFRNLAKTINDVLSVPKEDR